MQDESPEGGRFKKEVFVQGQSNMLLIRDEGGSPELQVSLHTLNTIVALLFSFLTIKINFCPQTVQLLGGRRHFRLQCVQFGIV